MNDEEVTDDGQAVCTGSGPEWASALIVDNPNWLRNRARNLIILADYLENRDEILARKRAVADAGRKKRRNELARELSPLLGVTFRELSPAACNAIDRIIDLEEAAK